MEKLTRAQLILHRKDVLKVNCHTDMQLGCTWQVYDEISVIAGGSLRREIVNRLADQVDEEIKNGTNA